MPHRWSRRQVVQGAGVASLALLAGCGRWPGQAQTPPKMYRLGSLALGSREPSLPFLEAVEGGLRELGYVRGQHYTMEERWAEDRAEQLPRLAAELAAFVPDLLLAADMSALHALQPATGAVPIVTVFHVDPVATGVVASLARPGGNVTGPGSMSMQLVGKRLELLKESVPELSRVAILWNAAYPMKVLDWTETQAAAEVLGLQVRSVEVRGPVPDLESAFAAMVRDRADALMTLHDPTIDDRRSHVVQLATEAGLAAMYSRPDFVAAGGLMAYAPNLPALYRRSAYYIDRILRGAMPADLPIEQPMRFDFVINLRTAQALGLTIPQHVLLQATEVIQ